MTVATHKTHAPTDVGCLVLTVSDTRTERGDTSGRAIRDLLVEHGHTVAGAAIVPDDPERVATTIRDHLADPATRIVIARPEERASPHATGRVHPGIRRAAATGFF